MRLRSLAASDIESAIGYYRGEAGAAVAVKFVEALQRATEQIRRSPNVASLRFSHEVGVPELRVRSGRKFPYLIFYVPSEGWIDVWRVLHDRRDLPASFADPL